MRLYLARHGDAVSAEQDPERPLSRIGRREVSKMAAFMTKAGVSAGRILHSGKRRAAETASIYAKALNDGAATEQMDGLKPNDPPSTLLAMIDTFTTDTLIAGHNPHLSLIAETLLCGGADGAGLDLTTGAVICLRRGDDGAWRLSWMMTPALLD